METVQTLHPQCRKLAIFASSSDKNVDGMLDLLLPVFDEVILTRFVKNPRALDVDALHQLALNNRARLPAEQQPILHTADDPESAWQMARDRLRPDDALYVAGSFFLAAELRGTILRDCQSEKPPAT